MKKHTLSIWILVALILGVLVGALAPNIAIKMLPLATIFLRMVKMIIAPLLFSTLVIGISGHGNVKKLGRIGLKTLVYFEIVTTLALFIGTCAANIAAPHISRLDFGNLPHIGQILKMSSTVHYHSFSSFVIEMFPTSIVQALTENNLLQIVVFSIFFALAMCAVGEKAQPIKDLLESVCKIMFKFTEFVMVFAPVGIFGAISYTVGANGLMVLKNYAKIIGLLYVTLFIFVITVFFLICKLIKISLFSLLKVLEEPILLAFSTASSEAALPKAMEIMENFGVPKSIVGFVMPTGYTFNLDGSTLYLAIAVVFCAQVAGFHLPIEQQLVIMFALMLTSKGIAGVPRVAMIVLAGTLIGFKIPVIGVAVLLGVDQLLDMGRTTVNLIGNCLATAVIARWENEFDYDKMNSYISSSISNHTENA